MRKPPSQKQPTHRKRLERLRAAFEAYRSASPGQRIPQVLRAQAVAAVAAGASSSAVREACRLSWTQLTRWRQAAESEGGTPPPAPVGSSETAARVFSVVDGAQSDRSELGDELELRIGHWHVSLRRVVG